jgi:hypothetical protein
MNNRRQDCETGTLCGGIFGRERGNEEDEGEGIWWMDFTYFYETEQRNLLP